MREAIRPLLNTSSWRDTYLSTGTNLTFNFIFILYKFNRDYI